MTTPITAVSPALSPLDPDEPGVDEEEARRRRIERNEPLLAILDQWIAQGENASEEEHRIAEEEWQKLKQALDEDRLPGSKLFRESIRCSRLRALGLLAIPLEQVEALQCEQWTPGLIAGGAEVVVSEIVDYELRRELLRLELIRSVRRPDVLLTTPGVRYVPVTTEAMRLAAQRWAEMRRAGRPTTDPHALDIDVILAA